MEKFKRILVKILNPGPGVVVSGIPVTVALMIHVFAFGHESEPIAYIAYVISSYAATILVVWLVQHLKGQIRAVKTYLRRNRYVDRYFGDSAFKYTMQLYRSTGMNLLYVALKFGTGIYGHSVWLITLGVYYAFLLTMRVLLLRRLQPEQMGKDLKMEYRRYRACAVVLLFMNIALIGMVTLSIKEDHGVRYPENMIYAVAAYDFYIIISATVNMIKVRKHGSPIIAASRIINFAASLVAMLSLETAMLAEFHPDGNDRFPHVMLAATGAGVSAVFVGMAVWMIVHANKELTQMQEATF